MNMRWAWIVPVLSSLASMVVGTTCWAQGLPMPMQPSMAPMGPMPGQPMHAGPMYGPLPDAYGAYGSVPAGYGPQMPMDPAMMGGMGGPMMGGMGDPMGGMGGPMMGGMGCPQCGGYGCGFCGGGQGGMGGHGHGGPHGLGNGLLGDILGIVGPYPDGGCAAIRWYDFAVDFMMLKRDDVGRNIPLASQGIGGPVVLQTGDLDFNEEPSFRFSAQFQVGPAASVEFTYFGLFHWQDSAFVRTQDQDLFSVFSNFGLLPFGGFDETDAADFMSMNYTSTFDSFEINFRQRWMAPNCRYQGSWLVGVRHFILDEQFEFFTSARVPDRDPFNPAQSRTTVDTTNALTGLQIGGDVWLCVLPGLRLGSEAKAGVYGNHMNVNTTLGVTTADVDFIEQQSGNDVAFVGQIDLLATYRINYQWTARFGYQFLYVDGVALATNNFNPQPPALFSPAPATPRAPLFDDDGNVFYHGWFIGTEFMW
jgi:hypothetical protein